MSVNNAAPQKDEKDEKLEELEKRYKEVTDKQGWLSNKSPLLGESAALKGCSFLLKKSDIENNIDTKNVINLYKEGKVNYETATKTIDCMDKANEICVNVAGNILTGFLATSAGMLAKGKYKMSMPKVAIITTLIGATVKPLFNFVDRALNNIKGDEFDSKKIVKDAASGGLNGLMSGINAGFGKEFTTHSAVRKTGFELLKQAGLILWQKIIHTDKDS